MKKTFTLVFSTLIISSVMAQAPQRFSYQAVIRDAENLPVANQMLGVQVSILQDSDIGNAVYVETHEPISNSGGLIGLEIGSGNILTGDFASIDWSDGPWFIKTETDPAGGDDYSIFGISEFLSVPYALYALNSAPGAQGPAGNDGVAGPQGPTGNDGAIGPEGPMGPQGLQGIPGIDGQDGAAGATGPQGPDGNDGAVGPIGPQGVQGIPGINGQNGAAGPQGPAGIEGTTGPQGPAGLNGLTTSVNGVEQVNGNITLTKFDLDLSNVDNSSDFNKPISAATQTALNDKANLASPVFTGTPVVPTAPNGTNSTQAASTAFVQATVTATKISQAIEAYAQELSISNSGALFYSQHSGFPAFPETLPDGYQCEIVNYSNFDGGLSVPGTARFHSVDQGVTTSITLPANGSIHINVVNINGTTRYYVR